MRYTFLKIYVLCVFTFLQTVIKELNLSLKSKKPHIVSKERRLSYSIAFKIEVVNYAKKHGNRTAERRFGSPPSEKMIREWRKQRKDLIQADKSKKTICSCAPKGPKLEEYVKNWIIDHRKNGVAVSMKIILIEARRLAIEMSITYSAGTTLWCERFMRRNGLCMCTTIAQKLPHEYKRKIIDYEVPLMFDVPSNKTVDVKGAKTIMIKTSSNEKTRYTVVLACCADWHKSASGQKGNILNIRCSTGKFLLDIIKVIIRANLSRFPHELLNLPKLDV